MAMKVSAADGVKVYNVSSGKSIPDWLSEAKRKSLQKSDDYRRRLELIQDLEFPEAAHRLKASPDGKFIIATGIHPPRYRCFDLGQLSLKFEHHLDSEVVDFEILSDDYSKLAMACADRSILFQAKAGTHHKTRIPRCARDLLYVPYTADLLIAASSNEIYRLNLEEGCFQAPLTSQSSAVNTLGISPAHGLVGAAGEGGLLECFDARQEKRGRLSAWHKILIARSTPAGTLQAGADLTAIQFDDGGLHCAVGTSTGLVALFDLRASKPVLVKDHMYSSRIVDLKFHVGLGGRGAAAKCVVSADRHIVRVWDAATGQGFTNIQPPKQGINDVLLWKDSGLLMIACDDPKIQAYFVPSLGAAPKWCSFLEGLTEEMEETDTPTLYDDFRFVTRDELRGVGMSHLIGSTLLKAYMHGFFVHNKLWQKAKAIAAPVDYSSLRKERIQAKLEGERAQRITLKRKLPKVNAALAAKLDAEAAEDGGKKRKPGRDLLADERFESMFTDPAFAIDEAAEEYRVLHPNADKRRDKRLVDEHFEALDGDAASESPVASGSDSSDDDIEAGQSDEAMDEGPSPSGRSQGAEQHRLAHLGQRGRGRRKPSSGPRMLAAKSDAAAAAFGEKQSLSALHGLPLAERSERAVMHSGREGFRVGGQRELTFIPRARGGRGRASRGAVNGGRERRPLDGGPGRRGKARGGRRGGRMSRGRS